MNGERNSGGANNPYLSSSFKIWLVGFIFVLIFLHLFAAIALPRSGLISEKIILGTVLALMAYLWVQEVRDRHRLEFINNELYRAQKRLQEAQVDTISSLILMEEAKDPYIHGHSRRVMKFSLAIADALGFTPARREFVRRAAILHDLGKLLVPDEILHKPGKLTGQEWEVIKEHPKISADILEPLRFLNRERKIILHHHERIDGQGYPAGLKGEDIPLESRIIAVADTFDAMNSARLYREPCTREYIIEELRKVSGTQLDPRLVLRFLEILEKTPAFWKREEETADEPSTPSLA